jgi:hypothetical protein
MLALPVRLFATLLAFANATPWCVVRSTGINQLITLVFEILAEVVATLQWLGPPCFALTVIGVTRVDLAALPFEKVIGAVVPTIFSVAMLTRIQWVLGDFDFVAVTLAGAHEDLEHMLRCLGAAEVKQFRISSIVVICLIANRIACDAGFGIVCTVVENTGTKFYPESLDGPIFLDDGHAPNTGLMVRRR